MRASDYDSIILLCNPHIKKQPTKSRGTLYPIHGVDTVILVQKQLDQHQQEAAKQYATVITTPEERWKQLLNEYKGVIHRVTCNLKKTATA